MEIKVTDENQAAKAIIDSPTEETLKLLIGSLRLINQAVTTNADYNKQSMDEILLKLGKINIAELEETLKMSKERGTLLNNIIARLADSKIVDIRADDMGFVIFSLIEDWYESLVRKKKYEVLVTWAKRIGWFIATGTMGILLVKLINLMQSVAISLGAGSR